VEVLQGAEKKEKFWNKRLRRPSRAASDIEDEQVSRPLSARHSQADLLAWITDTPQSNFCSGASSSLAGRSLACCSSAFDRSRPAASPANSSAILITLPQPLRPVFIENVTPSF
jgi:hypothetical protein